MDDPAEKIYLSQIPKAQKSRLAPKTVSSVLNRLIVEKGYAAQQSIQLLQEEWKNAVGDAINSETRVGKIQRRVLFVLASNSIVLAELQYLKPKALKHLQAALPDFKLKDIRFQLSK
ncbi:MAG: DUF721 domain-containing protein [Pirellula sp.]